MRSGSRRGAGQPPELAPWQVRAIEIVASSRLCSEVVFGGGAALAAVHLHHRKSADVDFFVDRELPADELRPVARAVATNRIAVDIEVVPPRATLVLRQPSGVVGGIDFAYYPYDPVDRRTRWRGLTVESLLDMTVNKLGLAARFLLVNEVERMPRMIRKVGRAELLQFFEDRARELARGG